MPVPPDHRLLTAVHHETSGLRGLLQTLPSHTGAEPVSLVAMRQLHDRVMARHQLDRSLALPLQHAGPLHSSRLAQQAMLRLQQMAPAYLQRFLRHVDTLRAIEDAQALGGAKSRPPAPTQKATGPKSTS